MLLYIVGDPVPYNGFISWIVQLSNADDSFEYYAQFVLAVVIALLYLILLMGSLWFRARLPDTLRSQRSSTGVSDLECMPTVATKTKLNGYQMHNRDLTATGLCPFVLL